MKAICTLLLFSFSVLAFGQNENPYSVFGYDAIIMPEANKLQAKDSINQFYLINTDPLSAIGMVSINTEKRRITFFNKQGLIMAVDTLRYYDYARWLSVDPKSQFSSPYTGMGNNPVMMVDPDGQLAWFIPIIIGAVVGGTSQGIATSNNGGNFFDGFWKGALVGGVAGATGVGVGGAFSGSLGGFGSALAGGTSAGFVGGGLGSAINGGNFLDGAWRGALTGLAGAGLGGIGVGESFGANLALGIGEGAVTGAFGAALFGGDVGQGALYGGVAGGVFATATSPQLKNAIRGQGFRNNSRVLADFVAAGNHQAALDYFGFEGTYRPSLKSKNYESESYWGATNPRTGDISYGDLAFESYPTLRGTYAKEMYSSQNIRSGRGIAQIPQEFQGFGYDTFLEEVNGYVSAYKQQGLFSGHRFPFRGVNYYQTILDGFGVRYPSYPKSFIYRIPRRY